MEEVLPMGEDVIGSDVRCLKLGSAVGVYATGSGNGTVEITGWGLPYRSSATGVAVRCLSFNGSNMALVWGDGDGVVRMITEEDRTIHTVGKHTGVSAIFLHPNLPVALSGSIHGTVVLWDIQRRAFQRAHGGNAGSIRHVCMSQDATHIAALSHSGVLQTWDSEGGQQFYVDSVSASNVSDVAFHPTRSEFAVLRENVSSATIWDFSTMKPLARTQSGEVQPQRIVYSSKGLLFSVSALNVVAYSENYMSIAAVPRRTVRAMSSVKDVSIAPDDTLVIEESFAQAEHAFYMVNLEQLLHVLGELPTAAISVEVPGGGASVISPISPPGGTMIGELPRYDALLSWLHISLVFL
jgi:WD40 repeat protein